MSHQRVENKDTSSMLGVSYSSLAFSDVFLSSLNQFYLISLQSGGGYIFTLIP
uniref:Uncharacterized protein n=1 Tax=Arion vulgaris TaxID=1028688 RepID=A0A0B7BW90_9EUPU